MKKMSLDLLCDTSKNKTTIVEMRISIFHLTEAFEMIDLFLKCNVQYMEVKYFNLGLQVLCVCVRAQVYVYIWDWVWVIIFLQYIVVDVHGQLSYEMTSKDIKFEIYLSSRVYYKIWKSGEMILGKVIH